VLAGPGSGKTDTLALKVANLALNEVPPTRGVACITYSRDAASEMRSRLVGLGLGSGARVFLGTVHSFCLICVLRTFAPIIGQAELSSRKVSSEKNSDLLLQRALDAAGVAERVEYIKTPLTVIRRRLACGEDVSQLGEDRVDVATRYETLLREAGLIDFEGIVLESLRLIEDFAIVRELLSAKFPWLLVDEYQDLGGPLHRIVLSLCERAGVRVFAVGDPDQTIYSFAGADPKYLEQLSTRPEFHVVRLRINYRSGSRLISASQAALGVGVHRPYEADPMRQDPGEVFFYDTPGGREGQIKLICEEILPGLRDSGQSLDEVAILYPRRGSFLDGLIERLERLEFPYSAERDLRFPRSPIIRWLQRSADWAIDPAPNRGTLFGELATAYESILVDSGRLGSEETSLSYRKLLFETFTEATEQHRSLRDWLEEVNQRLELVQILEGAARLDDVEDVTKLIDVPASAETTVSLFARDGRIAGRVVVTTLHGSKGRQFDVVILPTLQERILPRHTWSQKLRQWLEPNPRVLADERRLFYVGFTRARKAAFLIYSESFRDDKGYLVPAGPSRFVTEVQDRLGSTS